MYTKPVWKLIMEIPANVGHARSFPPSACEPDGNADPRNLRWVAVLWITLLVLGFTYTWDGRNAMNPDGISYLDISEAYVSKNFAAAINAYWSPLYSWLLASALLIFRPSPAWLFAIVHVVNFGIYVVCLACFRYFFSALKKNQPLWWIIFGYALFAWSSLALISTTTVGPDLCVAAFVYLAAGQLLRIRHRPARTHPLGFGLVLATGYLAKAAMLPISLLFIGIAWRLGYGRRRLVLTLLAFSLVAGSWAAAISRQKGRPTFGDAAKLNYAWLVNGTAVHIGWTGEPAGSGTPVHGPKKLYSEPAVLYYGDAPFKATVPAWYDPSYWYEGLKISFNARQQARAIGVALIQLTEILLSRPEAIGGLLVLAVLRVGWSSRLGPLLAVGLPAHLMYLVVGHIESRYVAPFLVLILVYAYSGFIRDDGAAGHTKVVAMLVTTSLLLGLFAAVPLRSLGALRDPWSPRLGPKEWAIALEVKRMGLQPGDKYAAIGSSSDKYFAKLAGISLVAELSAAEANRFFALDETRNSDVLATMAAAGVRAVIAEDPSTGPRGWSRLLDTGFFIKLLPRCPEALNMVNKPSLTAPEHGVVALDGTPPQTSRSCLDRPPSGPLL